MSSVRSASKVDPASTLDGVPEPSEPPGGETPAEAAEPPEQRLSAWQRLRRSRLGVAALLPALLLAAAFVALPFSGTSTHSVDQPGPSPTAAHASGADVQR